MAVTDLLARPSSPAAQWLATVGCHWALSETARIEIEHRPSYVGNDPTVQKPSYTHRREEDGIVNDGRGRGVWSRRGSLMAD